MNLKQRLAKADWCDFSTYPQQGKGIYIRVMSEDKGICQYVRINCFNAVSFEPERIMKSMKLNHYTGKSWLMSWVYVEQVQPKK